VPITPHVSAASTEAERPTEGRLPARRRATIFFRLTAWFLAIGLIPLAIGSAGAYFTYRRSLGRAAQSALDGIATARARQIESYMKERRREVTGLAGQPGLAALLSSLQGLAAGGWAPSSPAVDEALSGLADLYVERRGYSDLVLLSPSGTILFASEHRDARGRSMGDAPYRATPLGRVLRAALQGDGTEISHVGSDPESHEPVAYIAAPVRRDGVTLGVVALAIDWGSVARILEPHTGLGRTGESYLAARDGDLVLFTTPLRHAAGAPDPRILRLGSPLGQPIQRAVGGERGHGIARAYDGSEVLAAWRPLPTLGWGLVVESDTREAFLPAARLRRGLILLATITAFLASVAALWVARSFTRPVVALTRIAERYAAGDLGARAAIRSRDEIGGLARSFGEMAGSLAESRTRLEETIRALQAKNEALVESETRFRELAANVDVAFWIFEVGKPGRYSYMSPAWERLTGRRASELGRGAELFVETVHPEDRDAAVRAWDEVVANGRGESVFRLLRADGTVRWVRSRASAMPAEPGGPPRFAGITEDITERREAEAALQASEEMFRRLAETTRLVPWEASVREDRFTYVGPQAADLLGAPLEAWHQPGFWRERIHPEDRERVLAAGARLAGGDAHFEVEYRMLAASGEPVWVQDLVSVFRTADGSVGVRGFFIDITGRKRAEAEREELLATARAARQRAEDASRLKDEFLATVSHELRTPLNAILGWSQVLEDDDVDPEGARRAISTIARNARSQARLIDDLLDISRIITGRLRLETRAIPELGTIVDAAAGSLRLAAEAKAIDLRVTLEARVGPILGDPTRLQQVVWNLVSNAIKFTPRGGEVRVELTCEEDLGRLVVRDTGEGIRPDFLPYVFDRFRQGDGGTTRVHGGLGLGLAIVRQLVELHGGDVTVASDGVGRGATFTVTLPIMAAQDDDRRARGDEPPARPEDPHLDGLRVLAVDDEPDSLELVRTILERCRVHVDTATSAVEALRRIAEGGTDLLIADVAMPDRDGFWLIREVRGLAPEAGGSTPAVALTALARAEDKRALLAAGYQVHLAKPITAEQLTGTVAVLAGRAPAPAAGDPDPTTA